MVETKAAQELARDGATLRAVNDTRGLVLAERVEVAASSWRRMRGLLGRPLLGPDQGLLIRPCQGVHSLGMGYPIDVIHLDRQGLVVRVLRRLPPWRVGPLVWRSRLVLELAAGTADGTYEGDRLAFGPLDAPARN